MKYLKYRNATPSFFQLTTDKIEFTGFADRDEDHSGLVYITFIFWLVAQFFLELFSICDDDVNDIISCRL